MPGRTGRRLLATRSPNPTVAAGTAASTVLCVRRKNVKKCLATPAGIVTRGVILRALGEYMQKFKTRRPRALTFRSLLVAVSGALLLLAAFGPSAKADLIAYFNFEGPPTPPYPVNFQSKVPPGFLLTTMTTNYTPADTSADVGVPLNAPPGDPDPNAIGLGLSKSALNSPANFDIPLFTAQGFFQNMSISFAINVTGNGFTTAALLYSTNGGRTFTQTPGQIFALPPSGTTVVSFSVPPVANNAPLLVLRLQFTGGGSNGNNVQNILDNIHFAGDAADNSLVSINGTIAPEPATVAGGLVGVLGLCWHQRRRLIRHVRFRKA